MKLGNARNPLFYEHPGEQPDNQKGSVLTLKSARRLLSDEIPVPPGDVMQYNEPPVRHLENGRYDSETLRSILASAGVNTESFKRFMEFGCSNGRVLRWFSDWTKNAEGWGVDINSKAIMWAMANLRPNFKFCLTTTLPHLPFSDGYFSFVFCFSIFTHIDDMFVSWLLELKRVIEAEGYLYFTIHDETTVQIMRESKHDVPVYKMARESESINQLMLGEVDMVSINRDTHSQVFFRRDFIVDIVSDFFEVVQIRERTMAGFQTGILVRNRSR